MYTRSVQLREENNVKSWGQKHSENKHRYSVSDSSYPPLSFLSPSQTPLIFLLKIFYKLLFL